MLFFKIKVIYFLSFSVTDIVLETMDFSKNGIFPLVWCFPLQCYPSYWWRVRWAVLMVPAALRGEGGRHSAACGWQGSSTCHILLGIRWRLMSRNSSLAFSLWRFCLIFHWWALAQEKVLWTLLQMSSFPPKRSNKPLAPTLGLFSFVEF